MANSRQQGITGAEVQSPGPVVFNPAPGQGAVLPARTRGILGSQDAGDPTRWSAPGDTPGPLGASDHAATDPASAAGAKVVAPGLSQQGSAPVQAIAVSTVTAPESAIQTLRANAQVAPWMTVALKDAVTYGGQDEKVVTKDHNYHRLVTTDDRAGGRVDVLKDKKGKPRLGKDKQPLTRTHFDGADSLSTTPWCASFVNYCLREAGLEPGRRHMSSYTFGEDKTLFVPIKQPIYGAIRFSTRDGGGHVCFVYGCIGSKLVILGGNQTDQLCFQLRDKVEAGSVFYVPMSYKDTAATASAAVLPDIDLKALRDEFGKAVLITDAQVKSAKVGKQKES